MQKSKNNLLSNVASYYSEKLAQHGQTPRGVDWNGEGSQTLRFEQLCKVIDSKQENFSLNDIGCGYGALFDYLQDRYPLASYLGLDVSEEMIFAANSRHGIGSSAKFIAASQPEMVADYGVASGIFNVRLGHSDGEWEDYLQSSLDILDKTSRLGFAFNCLTSYSDEEKKQDYLYYADPCKLFDLCKRSYSRQVALLHDYGLYEFTVLVKKI